MHFFQKRMTISNSRDIPGFNRFPLRIKKREMRIYRRSKKKFRKQILKNLTLSEHFLNPSNSFNVYVSNSVLNTICYFFSGLHSLWQPGSRAARKQREKKKMKRKWRENEEMERDSLSTFPHSLFISSLSMHFLYQNLSHFVTKC